MWGITGTGYVLKESVDLMKELQEEYNVDITVMCSREGAIVVKWYKLWQYLTETVKRIKIEVSPNNPFYAGPLQVGMYDFFIVCPVSANTVAKIVHGIADSLITNCVAQAVKGGVEVFLFPSDQDVEPITTSRPDGTALTLKIRDIELENIERLKNLEGITVIRDFSEIKPLIIETVEKVK
jgi:archaeoflavoprotein AfpA